MSSFKHIRLDKLINPEFDLRLTENPEADDELRDSIRENGILEPLLVKDTSNGYEIIAGNRRFKQAIRAGLAAAPCIVIQTTGAATDKIQLHENIKRLPLSHVDQAYTFSHLIKKYDMTEQQIATLVGKSIAYVSQHLSLLNCDDKLLQAVQDGRINFSTARELFQCKDQDELHRFINIVENNGASTDVVKTWVHESNRETDLVNEPLNKPPLNQLPATPVLPMYPCAACEVPINIPDIKIVRLCPECHNLIFSEISREKQKLRMESIKKDS